MFRLEWETVKSSEPVKETAPTTQSPAPVDKETVVTTQAEAFPPPVAMLQVSTWCVCYGMCCFTFLFIKHGGNCPK